MNTSEQDFKSDFLGDLVSGEIEIPDVPSPPTPNETPGEFATGFLSDTAQGFFLGIVTNVLKHLIDSPTAPPKKKVTKK